MMQYINMTYHDCVRSLSSIHTAYSKYTRIAYVPLGLGKIVCSCWDYENDNA